MTDTRTPSPGDTLELDVIPRLIKLADEMGAGFYSAMHRAYGTHYSHRAEKLLAHDLRVAVRKLAAMPSLGDGERG